MEEFIQSDELQGMLDYEAEMEMLSLWPGLSC